MHKVACLPALALVALLRALRLLLAENQDVLGARLVLTLVIPVGLPLPVEVVDSYQEGPAVGEP